MKYSTASAKQRRERRERYVIEQGGLCYHCNEPLNTQPKKRRSIKWSLFPPHFLKHPVHLHHDHNTDETLGAVHAYCNAELWQYYGE